MRRSRPQHLLQDLPGFAVPRAGDGDHGAGMVRGFKAAVAAAETDGGSAGQLLVRAGAAFSDAAGGASGALVGTLIMTIGPGFP